MKILVIHQNYLMPGQPGGSRFNEFARMWSEAGHEVTVVTGTVNYTTGQMPDKYRGRWITHERDGEVDVLRCYVPESYGKSYLGRAWAFAGFTLSATSAVLRLKDYDIVIATSPPLVVAVTGWAAARLRSAKVPWIFEVRDLWPESAVTTKVMGANSPLTRLLYALERWAYRRADHLTVLTPAFTEDIVRRGLAPRGKIDLVPNGADASFVPGARDNDCRRELGWGDRFVVLYAGAHGRSNALDQLLDAADQLRDRPDILIASVGDGPERKRLEAESKQRGLNNIVFHGPRPKDLMPQIVCAADVGAAVLQDNPTFRTVYPNKVFDYMACERPVLLAIDGVARELVCGQAQAGIFAQPEDGAAIATAIKTLCDDARLRQELGQRGRDWVLNNATRSGIAQRYLRIMQRVIGGGVAQREHVGATAAVDAQQPSPPTIAAGETSNNPQGDSKPRTDTTASLN